ncbi:Mitochondrial genome maintenance protein [Smittium mucronatum]|uniref:Mitochondrial genome maintenance protein MGM101 n=1 Tax=Smittium mucronatum TaxID=133383 RepID=A0A1R0GRP3_9FUNG|nr:Mitochondrial genome maintenance protein [Smittium mucronatum]
MYSIIRTQRLLKCAGLRKVLFQNHSASGYSSRIIKKASSASQIPEKSASNPDPKETKSEPGKDPNFFKELDETILSKANPLESSQTHLGKPYLENGSDWQVDNQFFGVSKQPFEQPVVDILLAPIDPKDIEIKPDGLLYLPEIKYRRVLNRAFGPGGWGLIPRGSYSTNNTILSREYALICLGRFVSIARGEQEFFGENGLATATEGVKSNALMRCCKDLGIASELWDPSFIVDYKKQYCVSEWVTHVTKGNKKLVWRLKSRSFEYPWVKK